MVTRITKMKSPYFFYSTDICPMFPVKSKAKKAREREKEREREKRKNKKKILSFSHQGVPDYQYLT